jgi:hypothetical protein
MFLKLDNEEKVLIEEVSALSGIQKEVLRECWEFLLIHWAEQLAANPDKVTKLHIPFLGVVAVRFKDDEVLATGELQANVDAFVALTPQFRKLVGDIHDEGECLVTDLLRKKIETAILTSSSKGD